MLETQERKNKRKYLLLCLNQRKHLTPFVISEDGLIGREVRMLLNNFTLVWPPSGSAHPHKHTTISTLAWVWTYPDPLVAVSMGRRYRPKWQAALYYPLDMDQESASTKIPQTKHNHESNKIHTHVSTIYSSQSTHPLHTPRLLKFLIPLVHL